MFIWQNDRAWPNQQQMVQELKAAGWSENVHYVNQTGGSWLALRGTTRLTPGRGTY